MRSLILKDIYLQKKMFLFTLGYSLFILVAFQNPVFSSAAYIMGSVAAAYMFILGACAYEEKNKSEIILNSLPLRRGDIVKARYLSALVFSLLSLGIIGFLGAVMKGLGLPFPLRYMSLYDVTGVLVSLSLLVSLYFPVFFRYGYINSRFFNMILFFLVFFGPNLVVSYLKDKMSLEMVEQMFRGINIRMDWAITLALFFIALSLTMVSLRISMLFYAKREF